MGRKKRKRDRERQPSPGSKQQKIAGAGTAAGAGGARVYTCKICGTASEDAPWFSNHVRECKNKAFEGVVRDGKGKPVLNGLVLSISVWQAPATLTAVRSSASVSRIWDETKVKVLLRELGAKHSRNVHKKVKYLIASEAAVKRNTQNVRKAAKRGIPIILPTFLVACKSRKCHVDAAPYLLTQKKESKHKALAPLPGGGEMVVMNEADSEKEKKDVAEAERELGCSVLMEHAETFDFGCCCSCHDSDCWLDGKKPTDCDWCHDVCYAK